jgi:cytochrome c oxidase cbb3-type subunit III
VIRLRKQQRRGVWSIAGCGRTLLPILAALSAGCDFPGRPKLADRPVAEDRVLSIEVLYRTNCAGCHGADGRLGPAPPLNDPLFLSIVPDSELLRVIREGRPGTPMPAFARDRAGPLTDAQVNVLAEGLKPRWGTARPSTDGSPPYLADRAPRGTTAGDAAQGADVFTMACAHCHGDEGGGGEYHDRKIGAINVPAFLALISDQALRRYAITGRPDLGMPNYAGKDGRSSEFQALTAQDVADLVAFLGAWRQAGKDGGHQALLPDADTRKLHAHLVK